MIGGDAFRLIAVAGDTKSDAMNAIKAARNKDYEKAEELLASADQKMAIAHEIQFEVIQQEANGNRVDLNIILVHAQDHLTMALVMRDMAELPVYGMD